MTKTEEFKINGQDLMVKIREIINQGNVRRISIKDKNGKTIAEFPLTIGVVGVALAAPLAAIGTIAALVTECTISIEKEE